MLSNPPKSAGFAFKRKNMVLIPSNSMRLKLKERGGDSVWR
jgi:hypothetical protein